MPSEGQMSGTLAKAQTELDVMGTPIDDSGRIAVEALLGMLSTLPYMDSETARNWVVDKFSRLARQEVLTPLTGADWEWVQIPANQRGRWGFQNKREYSVMANREMYYVRESDVHVREWRIVEAVDTESLVMMQEAPDGGEPLARVDWAPISFPYMPQRYHYNLPDDWRGNWDEMADRIRQTLVQVTPVAVQTEKGDEG